MREIVTGIALICLVVPLPLILTLHVLGLAIGLAPIETLKGAMDANSPTSFVYVALATMELVGLCGIIFWNDDGKKAEKDD